MTPKNRTRVTLLSLAAYLFAASLTGCGGHDRTVQAPAGTRIGGPLTPAQIQAIQQKRQGAMQQHAQGQ